ncbi:hypothetical protein JOF53_000508 [Crossiella equi]|uniref:DUF5709 domain-containing protein n=1 Tax=Crossiella equi TaxID=130796 RepID=A0ABS5A5R4_9PSEU|nr:hypothetical protein [Crossiella equi]MBP2471636.1 hypothetical protein [Crossiella equi]
MTDPQYPPHPAEQLDEDAMGIDPVQDGVEPPEGWSEADRYGTTGRERTEGESHEQRLAEETADQQPDPVPERPLAETPDDQLDETIDEAPPPPDPELGEIEDPVELADRQDAAAQDGEGWPEVVDRSPEGDAMRVERG